MLLLFLLYMMMMIGVFFDFSFSLNSKFLFYFLFFLLNLILWWLQKNPLFFFLYDLFWYPCMLYMSIIWHVLMLNWMYYFFWKKEKYYMCHMMTMLSWMTSMSMMVAMLMQISKKLMLNNYECSSNKIIKWMSIIIMMIINMMIPVLSFFMMKFHEFVYFLQGKNRLSMKQHIEIWKKHYKELLLSLLKMMMMFMMTMMMSYLMMGMPSLYLMWIYLFLKASMDWMFEKWVKMMKAFNKFNEVLNLNWFLLKFKVALIYGWMFHNSNGPLMHPYEDIYFFLFNFNKLKFIYNFEGEIYDYSMWDLVYLKDLGFENKDSLKDLFTYEHPMDIMSEQYNMNKLILKYNAGENFGWAWMLDDSLMGYLESCDWPFETYELMDPEIPKGFKSLNEMASSDKEYMRKNGSDKFPYKSGECRFQ